MSVSRPYLTNRPTLKKIKATNTNVTFARTLKTNTHAAERGIKYKTHALTHAHENEKKNSKHTLQKNPRNDYSFRLTGNDCDLRLRMLCWHIKTNFYNRATLIAFPSTERLIVLQCEWTKKNGW